MDSYLIHTYSDINLPVLSTQEIRTQMFDQINVYVAIALLAFAFIEAFKLAHNWNPKDDNFNKTQGFLAITEIIRKAKAKIIRKKPNKTK